jgi:hypothetical protein
MEGNREWEKAGL